MVEGVAVDPQRKPIEKMMARHPDENLDGELAMQAVTGKGARTFIQHFHF